MRRATGSPIEDVLRWLSLHSESSGGARVKGVGQALDLVAHRQLVAPSRRDPVFAIESTGEQTVDGRRRVGVIAQIDGEEAPCLERARAIERPYRRLERRDDVARAFDVGWILSLERAPRHLGNRGRERAIEPKPRDRRIAW